MTGTKTVVAMVVAITVFYAAVIGVKGVALLGSGSTAGVLLGAGVLVLPLLAVLVVWREVQFGRRCARLAREMGTEGAPSVVDDLPRRPSGRVDRRAADARFAELRSQTEAAPDSWRAWFRLALAYDAAGDRPRARAAARHALALHG